MLDHCAALWSFVDTEAVEPTNDHTEPELRAFVLWRKRSFGPQSQRGNLLPNAPDDGGPHRAQAEEERARIPTACWCGRSHRCAAALTLRRLPDGYADFVTIG
jgi:hypothetical protein